MSNVVKSVEAADYGGALVFDFCDLEGRAAVITAEAEAEAARIIKAARARGEEMAAEAAREARAEGREKGREEGLQAGREEGHREAFEKAQAETEKLAQTLGSALAEFSSLKDGLFVQAEKELLDLAMLIARKVVSREVEADRHVTTENLARCLEILSGHGNVTVRVAPDVLDNVKKCLPELLKTADNLSSVTIEGDPDVSPGGCVVNSKAGLLDAQIETQFGEIERILFGNGDG